MVLRLEEIKELDMSSLDRTEKRELKSEIREINKELKKNGGGVYLSVGALLVVIILLILLLWSEKMDTASYQFPTTGFS